MQTLNVELLLIISNIRRRNFCCLERDSASRYRWHGSFMLIWILTKVSNPYIAIAVPRLWRKYIVIAILRVLCWTSRARARELIVDVPKLGMGVLPKHERCFHEGRPCGLAGQAKIEHGSIIKVVFWISAHTSVELLLIREDSIRGRVAFDIGVSFVVKRVSGRSIAFFVACLFLLLTFSIVLARCFEYLFLDWLLYLIFFYVQSLGKLPPILGDIQILVTVNGTISQIELTLCIACYVVLIVSAELIGESYRWAVSRVGASVTTIALIVLINCVEFALRGCAEIVGTHLVQIRQILMLHISSCLKRGSFDVRIQLVL